MCKMHTLQRNHIDWIKLFSDGMNHSEWYYFWHAFIQSLVLLFSRAFYSYFLTYFFVRSYFFPFFHNDFLSNSSILFFFHHFPLVFNHFIFFNFFSLIFFRGCVRDCMSKIHNDRNKWIYCIEMVSYSTWHIEQSNAWIIRLKWIPAYFMRRVELMLKVPISISYTILTATCFSRYDRMFQDIFLGVCSINNITTPNQHQIFRW